MGYFRLTVIFVLAFFSAVNNGYSQAPNYLWFHGYGDQNWQRISDMVSDTVGNIYVTGEFTGSSLTLGTYTVNNTNPNFTDIFIAKLDGNGTILWLNSFGGSDFDYPTKLSLDDANNIYVTGVFLSLNINVGSISLINNGAQDIFLSKFDNNGNIIWAEQFGGADWDFCHSLVSFNSDYLYITGSFVSPSIDFGNYTVNNSTFGLLSSSIYIAKLDTSGNTIWARSAISEVSDDAYDITIDQDGNSYITGYFSSQQIIFDSDTLFNSFIIYDDIFLVKFNPDGEVIWAISGGGDGMDFGGRVYIDNAGDVLLAGSYESDSIIFGNVNLPWLNGANFYISKFDSSGSLLWIKGYAGNHDDGLLGICNDSNNNIFIIISSYSDSLAIDGFTMSNLGNSEVYIAKLSANGNAQWTKEIHGLYNETAVDILLTQNNDIVIGGYTGSPIVYYDSDSIINNGSLDIFLAKIGSSTGLPETENDSISIFPNPVYNKLNFNLNNAGLIYIYDLKGNLILTRFLNKGYSFVDVSTISSGLYILSINNFRTKFAKY